MCSDGFVISAREPRLSPSPRTRAAVNFDRSEMVVFIEPAARTLLALVMRLRLALIVPAIGDVGVLTVVPHQACAGHAQTVEVGLASDRRHPAPGLAPCGRVR